MIPPSESFIEQLINLWPAASTVVAAVLAWFSAKWKAGKDLESKMVEKLDALRERAHTTEIELAQIRAVLSAATGLKFSELTLKMVQDLLANQSTTLKELETFVLTMPRLMWIKRRESPGIYTMIQVSQVYADKYLGGCPKKYAGKRDSDIWPTDVVRIFAENDEKAYLSGKVVDILEPIHSTISGVRGQFKGVKWSFTLDKQTYICGLGVHIEGEQ